MDERLVVPIIGPDAVVIDGEVGPRPYSEYLARWVESALELSPGDQPASDLNEVACRFLQMRGASRDELYTAVKVAVDENPVDPPPELRRLAGITAFKLYVTTEIDDLLRTAIDAARFKGQRRTRPFAYAPQRAEDLPASLSSFSYPVVYHLFGRASAEQDYVVTEEDLLEFMHSLQSASRPRRLLDDELKPRTRLIIGSGYSDWLARFFLRVAKSERLRDAPRTDVLAEEDEGAGVGAFLQHFNAQTRLYPGGALAFINALADQWEEYVKTHPQKEPEPVDTDVVEYAIFINYASEDLAIAQELAAALTAADLPVWLDVDELRGGDDWERKLSLRIDLASVFVPVLTPRVLHDTRRFFRAEWSFAEPTARKASAKQPFVAPVCIGVEKDEENIPEYIRRAQWMTVDENNRRYDAVVERLKELYEGYLRTQDGKR
jgi:hypothetical protein